MKKWKFSIKKFILIFIPILLLNLCLSMPKIVHQVNLNSVISKSTRSKLDYQQIYKNYEQLENAGYKYSTYKGYYIVNYAYKDISAYSRLIEIVIRRLHPELERKDEEANLYDKSRIVLSKGLIEIDIRFKEMKNKKDKEKVRLAIEEEINSIMNAVADK